MVWKIDGAEPSDVVKAQMRQSLGAAGNAVSEYAEKIAALAPAQFGPFVRAVKRWEGIIVPAYEPMTLNGVTRAAIGDAICCRGTVDAGDATRLSLDLHTVSEADIGKLVRHVSWDTVDYRVTGVDIPANKLIVTPSLASVTWETLWWVGHDDTSRLQACLDEAATMRTRSQISNQDAGKGMLPRAGKVELLHGANHGMFLTQAAFTGGQKAALQIPRRVTFGSVGRGDYGATLSAIPGAYGSMLAPKLYAGSCDLVSVHDLVLSINGDMSADHQYGIDWEVMDPGASAGGLSWASVDPYNRFDNIYIRGAVKGGARFKGAGELRLRNFNVVESKELGLWMDHQNDWKLNGGTMAGCGWSGLRVSGGGTHEAIGWKIYFCGKSGGSDGDKCCGLLLDGDSQGHAQGYFNGEIQETRGAGVVVKTGNAKLDIRVFDPFRHNSQMGQDTVSGVTAGAAGARPAVRTAVHLSGPYCKNNELLITAAPSVAQWPTNQNASWQHNWASGVSLVHVDDYVAGTGGPQANVGVVRTRKDTLNGAGATEVGTELLGGATKVSGFAANGKNIGLVVDGLALT